MVRDLIWWPSEVGCVARRRKKSLQALTSGKAYERAMKALEARIDGLAKEERGPATNKVYGWELKAMAYDPKTLELFSDLAIASAYEVKDLYYGDDPDFQLWISRIPGAYGSDASGQFLPEKDVVIVDPFVIMESDHDTCVELVNTLSHEMLHRWCQRRGIEELTPFEHPEFGRIPYHNELFKKHAEAHGMEAELAVDGYSDTGFTDDEWVRIVRRCPVTAHFLVEAQSYPLARKGLQL